MTVRRSAIPAATALVVVVIATGAGVAARRNQSHTPTASRIGSPQLPPLATSNAGGVADATAAIGAPQAGVKEGRPAGTGVPTVTIKGQLPAADGALVVAYRLERRATAQGDVTALAKALGIEGSPVHQVGAWQVTDGKRTVSVQPTPGLDWQLLPGDATCSGAESGSAGSGGGTTGIAPPDRRVVPPTEPKTADAKPATDPDTPTAVEAPAAADAPLAQGCGGSTAVSSGVVCAQSADSEVACPTPPAKPLASEDVARAAALNLAKATGLSADKADVYVDAGYDGVRHVSVRRRVDGRVVDGMNTEVGVDASGNVVTASGQLAVLVVAGEYPMTPAAELASHLGDHRMQMMLCLQKPGVDGCAPPPPIVVTGATVGLALAPPADYEKGEAYLLPAWLFTVEGENQPTAVIAVPAKYRTDSKPEIKPGAGTKPLPAEQVEPNSLPPDQVAPKDLPAPSKDMPEPPAIGMPLGSGGAPAVAQRVAPRPVLTGDSRAPDEAGVMGPLPGLPTSTWTAGGSSMAAEIVGTLVEDEHGCLVLSAGPDAGQPTSLLWPAGSKAARDGKSVVVTSADGTVMARTGESFTAGGGVSDVGTTPSSPCVTADGLFMIEDSGPYND